MTYKFFQTMAGQRFYKHSIPTIAKSLTDIAESINKEGRVVFTQFEINKMKDNIQKLCQIEIQDDNDIFYQTAMGKRYYNSIIPDIANNLRDISSNLRFSNEDMFKIAMTARSLDGYLYNFKLREEPNELVIFNKKTGEEFVFKNATEFISFVENLSEIKEEA